MSILPPDTCSDAAMQRQVLDELRRDPYVRVSDIGVSVKEGVVTLTGLVENFLMRMAAQNAALRVAGVHAVANDIEVWLHTTTERSDSDLALAALYALKWDVAVPIDTLDVTVAHGYVTLKGTVEKPSQREAAERVIRGLRGVRGIANWITVVGVPASDDVRQRVEAALAPDLRPGIRDITVEAHGRALTLKGTVRSFSEKHAAERAALSTPGVHSVTNQIEVIREA